MGKRKVTTKYFIVLVEVANWFFEHRVYPIKY